VMAVSDAVARAVVSESLAIPMGRQSFALTLARAERQ